MACPRSWRIGTVETIGADTPMPTRRPSAASLGWKRKVTQVHTAMRENIEAQKMATYRAAGRPLDGRPIFQSSCNTLFEEGRLVGIISGSPEARAFNSPTI